MCHAWAATAGDAGWAGVLAATAAADTPRVAYLIYDPAAGHDPLPLLQEAMALLPPARRWPVAFATYFTDLPAGLSCHWRCCIAGSAAAKDARRNATSGVVLDLTTAMGEVPETALVRVARTGHAEVPVALSSTLTARAADTADAAAADAATFDTMKLMPLPVGPAATPGRLIARRPPAIPFGGDGHLPNGVPPQLPMGEIVDEPENERETHSPPAKTRIWLWVAAFIWPLLVIPAVIAWHVTADSKRNRDLQAKYDVAGRQVEESKTDKQNADQKASALQAQVDEDKSLADAASAKEKDLQRQLAAAREGESAAKAEVAKSRRLATTHPGPTATPPPATPPALHPVIPISTPVSSPEPMMTSTKLFPDPNDDGTTIVGPSMQADRIVFVDPYEKQGGLISEISADHKSVQLRFRSEDKSAAGSTSADPFLVGTLALSESDTLTWKPNVLAHSEQDLMNARTRLRSCMVELLRARDVVCRIQLGRPTATISVSNSTPTPVSVVGSTIASNSEMRVLRPLGPANSGWALESVGANLVELRFAAGPGKTYTFQIAFDPSKGMMTSTWARELESAKTASREGKRDVEKLKPELERLQSLYVQKKQESDSAATDPHVGQDRKESARNAAAAANESLQKVAGPSAEAAHRDADATAKVDALQRFAGLEVDIVNSTGLTLRHVTVKK